MQTGIVQPSGPSNHFWIIFGSVWARYTASGGAAKRLVTIMSVSPSVFSVILVIGFLLSLLLFFQPSFFSSLFFPFRRERRRAGRSFSPVLFAACQAIDPSLLCPPLRDDAGASPRQLGERSIPHLRALSSAGRLR